MNARRDLDPGDRPAVLVGHAGPGPRRPARARSRRLSDRAPLRPELVSQPTRPSRARANSLRRSSPVAFAACVVPGPRQDEAALAVGRRRGDRLRLEPAAADRPDLDVRHARAGLVHDPAGQVIRTRLGRIGHRGSRRPARPGQHDGRDRSRGGRQQRGDDQGQPREEHHLDHPFRQR